MSDLIDTPETTDINPDPQGTEPDVENSGGDTTPDLASNGQPFAVSSDGKKLGYPVDTSVKDMDPAEQAAYWKVQSRTWENRAKKKPDANSNDDEAEQLRARIAELEGAQLSEEQAAAQAAIEQAVAEARAETEAHYKGLLNREQLSSYARPYLKTDERVDKWLNDINQNGFLKDDGFVDATKVTEHFTAIYGELKDETTQPPERKPAEYRNGGQGQQGAKPKKDYKALASEQIAKRFPQDS